MSFHLCEKTPYLRRVQLWTRKPIGSWHLNGRIPTGSHRVLEVSVSKAAQDSQDHKKRPASSSFKKILLCLRELGKPQHKQIPLKFPKSWPFNAHKYISPFDAYQIRIEGHLFFRKMGRSRPFPRHSPFIVKCRMSPRRPGARGSASANLSATAKLFTWSLKRWPFRLGIILSHACWRLLSTFRISPQQTHFQHDGSSHFFLFPTWAFLYNVFVKGVCVFPPGRSPLSL